MRVLVTRAPEDADALVAALEAVGVEAVSAPMIARHVDVDVVRRGLAACPAPDVLLITSAAAARVLGDAGVDRLRPGRIAAVGPTSAAAARALGLTVDVVPAEATGVATVAALGDLRGRTVLYVQAAASVPATRAALSDAGADVVEVVAYTTVPHPERARNLAAAGAVDLATLASPSTARAYADARATIGGASPPVVVTGPTTAAACRALGLPVAAIAQPHTADGLVDTVRRLAGL